MPDLDFGVLDAKGLQLTCCILDVDLVAVVFAAAGFDYLVPDCPVARGDRGFGFEFGGLGETTLGFFITPAFIRSASLAFIAASNLFFSSCNLRYFYCSFLSRSLLLVLSGLSGAVKFASMESIAL